MRHWFRLVTVLSIVLCVVLTSAACAVADIVGPAPAVFLRMMNDPSGRRMMAFYVLGISDALQMSGQIECHAEKGKGPTPEAMTDMVADALRGQDPPPAVALAVVRVMSDGGCTPSR